MLFDEVRPNDYIIEDSQNGKFFAIKGPDVQIPKFRCNWGVSSMEYGGGSPKYSIEFGIHEGPRAVKFVKWVGDIEKRVINYVKEHSVDIFGDREPGDIEGMFRSSLKDGSFRVKVEDETIAKGGDGTMFDCKVAGTGKGQNCICVLRLKLLYFMNGTFGLSWSAVQLEFSQPKEETGVKKPRLQFLSY